MGNNTNKKDINVENEPEVEHGKDYENGSMIVVTDKNGNVWLCKKDVDPTKDLRKQGCWRCEERQNSTKKKYKE